MFDNVKLYAWQHNVKIPIDIIWVCKDDFTARVAAKDGYKITTEFVDFNSVYYTRSQVGTVPLWCIVDENGQHLEIVRQRIASVFGGVRADIHTNSLHSINADVLNRV